jgi:hypothetical protein
MADPGNHAKVGRLLVDEQRCSQRTQSEWGCCQGELVPHAGIGTDELLNKRQNGYDQNREDSLLADDCGLNRRKVGANTIDGNRQNKRTKQGYQGRRNQRLP